MYASKKTKVRTVYTGIIAVWSIMLFTMVALAVAQDQAEQALPVTEPAAQAAPVAEPAAEDMKIVDDDSANGAIQSISFKKDMSIKDALRFLALKYQKNIVPSSKVDGVITVTNLYNVTFEEALQAILGTNKYEIQGNFIRVYTLEEFQQDKARLANDVITLNYIPAAEALKLITPLKSEQGNIAATTAAALDTEAGNGGDSLSIRDQIVISDYPEVIAAAKKLIETIDVRPPQVLIEVTVLEAKLDETTKFGIDFDSLDASISSIGQDGISVSGLASGLSSTPANKGLNIGILNDHVRVFIRALEEITDTTVLANPKILALNKQAGKLLIGNEDGYESSKTIGDSGNQTSSEITFLVTGTKLEFRPFICEDGFIRMEIYPEQSSGEVDPSTGLPSKRTTTVKSNIMVEDGKTIVIGGLFQESTILSRAQVPLLGDLPVVGQIFRSTGDQSIRTELIVLITPHIIRDPQQADGAERLDDVQRLSYSARKNLTWMSRARIAEDRYAKAVKLYTEGNLDAAMRQLSGNLEIDRNFLEARRLKERIINDKQPGGSEYLERIMLDIIEREESAKWFRK